MSKSDWGRVEQTKSKIAGAMYGFAIGDAMGATTEFMCVGDIRRKYGTVENITGGGWLRLKPGQVTDDTEMMLCVANGYHNSIASGTDFVEEVSKQFIRWYNSNPVDCGATCATGICRLATGGKPVLDKSALGNGALMRALPMALVDRIELNWAQADLTHCNPTQRYFVEEYHNMVVRQVYGSEYGDEIAWRIDGNCDDLSSPTGHVANTMWNVVTHLQKSSCFESVILGAVNGGGDADTIAAIAGGLAGAKYGFENIPERWLSQLNPTVRKRLDKTIEFLVNCSANRHTEP